MPSIKMAERSDLPRVIELCLATASEFDHAGTWAPEPATIAAFMLDSWKLAPIFMVLDDEANLVGFSGLALNTHWWSKKPILMDYRTYILPCARGINTVKILYKEIAEYARLQGLPVYLAHHVQVGMDARRRLMRRLGFKEIECLFASNGGSHG